MRISGSDSPCNAATLTCQGTPDEWGLVYQDVSFTTSDDLALSAWFIPAPTAQGTVLFFHGNGGNISHRRESLVLFHRLGVNTLIVDYRGYGQSEGHPSERGTYQDAEAAWRYLTEERHLSPDQIIIFGRSLGGAVATYLASQHSPKALILESTFTSAGYSHSALSLSSSAVFVNNLL